MQAAEFSCDVLVVGSGAAAMVAASRAHDLGFKVLMIEKASVYGGTSAISGGGIWIPNHDDIKDRDSPEQALEYLRACTEGKTPDDKLRAYIQSAPEMLRYVRKLGVPYGHVEFYPDYYGDNPGAIKGRTLLPDKIIDGSILGDDFFRLRDQHSQDFKLFGRVSMLAFDAGALALRLPKWRRLFFSSLLRYWTDLPWRFKTPRDRMVTNGSAMMVMLRKAMLDRNIPLYLNTRFTGFISEGKQVTGITARRNDREIQVHARQAVILATGGFERNQTLRSKHLPAPTDQQWSGTVPDANVGDILQPVLDLGATAEHLDQAWWAPSMKYRTKSAPNYEQRFILFFQRAWPHSICVNRLGKRFTNEAVNYHVFGVNMLRDQEQTGANLPCWMIFDARFRSKYPLGVLMPGSVWGDWTVPQEWFGDIIHRADSIEALARQIDIDPATLGTTVQNFNHHAERGEDPEFHRGESEYDQFSGDPFQRPNSSLGSLAKGPFYAVRVDLGDLGTKGGPKIDADGRVLHRDGGVIGGLYAVGNCSGALTGPSYPGAGGTLGPSMTIAYRAAESITDAQDETPSGIRSKQEAATT